MIAVLGGTFDPVHLGHLHAAACVRKVFVPESILLVPCALAPHKRGETITSAEHRLTMLRHAVEGIDGLKVSTVEIDRGGVSYTLDTLRSLGRSRGGVAFIVGMDSLLEIHTWKGYVDLLRDYDVIAVDRPGGDLGRTREELDAEVVPRLVAVRFESGAAVCLPPPPPGAGGRVYHLPIPPLAVSSSDVRAAVMRGEPIDGLVPSRVARYIQERRLYEQEASR